MNGLIINLPSLIAVPHIRAMARIPFSCPSWCLSRSSSTRTGGRRHAPATRSW